ncbi:MAG: hypothetical protein KDB40_24160, partial [Acidimicrobiales bacterium]|nr:hypothetical protein [Acidimicrobiales bacterium]
MVVVTAGHPGAEPPATVVGADPSGHVTAAVVVGPPEPTAVVVVTAGHPGAEPPATVVGADPSGHVTAAVVVGPPEP